MRSIVALALLATCASGQTSFPILRARVGWNTPPGGFPNLGVSIDVDGNWLAAGAPGAGDTAPLSTSAGRVYVYARQGRSWSGVMEVAPPNGAAGDRFGAAVAFDSLRIAVGAPGTGPFSGPEDYGRVYVHEQGPYGWTATQIIDPPVVPNPQIGAFGAALALSGDWLFIGSPLDHEFSGGGSGTAPGGVYVYHRDPGGTWVLSSLLRASDAEHDARFGAALSHSGSALAVGAWKDGLVGAVYVFRESAGAWTEEAKLVASDPATAAYLGVSVSIDGDRIAAGAPEVADQGVPAGAGAAYVFDRGAQGWFETAKLRSAPPVIAARFGASVSVSGDRLLVGAPDEPVGNGTLGRGYMFAQSGGAWSAASSVYAGEWFGGLKQLGSSCLWDGATALFGAPDESTYSSGWGLCAHAGTIHVIDFAAPVGTLACDGQTGCPCGNAGAPGEGCANSTGHGAVLDVFGTASVAADDLWFALSSLPAGRYFALFSALPVTGGSFPTIGAGLKCFSAPRTRLWLGYSDALGASTSGELRAASGGWVPGDTRVLQGWFRDSGGPCSGGTNSTSAVEVTFLP